MNAAHPWRTTFPIGAIATAVLMIAASPAWAQSAREKIHFEFRTLAVELCSSALSEDQSEVDRAAAEMLGTELMERYGEGFAMTEEEAQSLVEGRFKDAENQRLFEGSVGQLSGVSGMLPLPVIHLIDRHHRGAYRSGLPLEFAVRLLQGYLAHARKEGLLSPP